MKVGKVRSTVVRDGNAMKVNGKKKSRAVRREDDGDDRA